jgi:hypothetical protein
VREVADEAQEHRAALLGRQLVHGGPQPVVARLERAVAGAAVAGDVGDRARAAGAAAVVVERLVVRDGQQPAAQVVGVAQARVGAQRGDHRLLEAVVGVDGADRGDAEAQHGLGVLVEQALERRGTSGERVGLVEREVERQRPPQGRREAVALLAGLGEQAAEDGGDVVEAR